MSSGKNYKLDNRTGILECEVYSIKSEDLERSQRFTETLGIESKEKLYGEPLRITINLNNCEGVAYYLPNKTELYEEGNFIGGTYLELGNGLSFVLLIEYNTFNQLYKEYISPEDDEVIEETSFFSKIKKYFK